jgi:hypothetical protein
MTNVGVTERDVVIVKMLSKLWVVFVRLSGLQLDFLKTNKCCHNIRFHRTLKFNQHRAMRQQKQGNVVLQTDVFKTWPPSKTAR